MSEKLEIIRMQANEARLRMRDVLDYVRAGGTIIIEHYHKPVARVHPYSEGHTDYRSPGGSRTVDGLIEQLQRLSAEGYGAYPIMLAETAWNGDAEVLAREIRLPDTRKG